MDSSQISRHYEIICEELLHLRFSADPKIKARARGIFDTLPSIPEGLNAETLHQYRREIQELTKLNRAQQA